MLVIRFQRTGRKNAPMFRLVCAEKNAPIKGGVKEYLGYYLPTRNPHVFECNKDRIAHWVGVGAQPSNSAARQLKKFGVDGMDKFMKSYTKKKKKNPTEEEIAAEEAKNAPPVVEEIPEAIDADAPAEKPKEETPAEAPKEEVKEDAPQEESKEEASQEENSDGDAQEKSE